MRYQVRGSRSARRACALSERSHKKWNAIATRMATKLYGRIFCIASDFSASGNTTTEITNQAPKTTSQSQSIDACSPEPLVVKNSRPLDMKAPTHMSTSNCGPEETKAGGPDRSKRSKFEPIRYGSQ